MTQLVYTAAGAFVGYLIGGPTGAQYGAAIGSSIGAIQAAPDQQGPRLQDRAVQVSSFGVGIPKVWGSDRIAGNLIWSTDLIETENTESAKGGPELTTFSYSVSCAVLICEGVKASVRRIWADAKLVYDASEDADDATKAASASFRPYFTFYTGTTTQLPDPTIESYEGAGNVEAYRDCCYIVFTDLPLADFGNRIPNFSFELSDSPESAVAYPTLYEPLRVYDWGYSNVPAHEFGDTRYQTAVASVGPSTVSTSYTTSAEQAAANYAASGEIRGYSAANSTIPLGGYYYTSDNDVLSIYDGGANIRTDPQYVYQLSFAVEQFDAGRYDLSELGALIGFLSTGPLEETVFLKVDDSYVIGFLSESSDPPSTDFNVSYASGPVGPSLRFLWGNTGVVLRAERLPTHPQYTCLPGDPCASDGGAQLPGNEAFCISCDGTIAPNYEWTIVTGGAKQLCAVEYRGGVLYQNALGPVLLPGDPNYSNAAFWNAAFTAALDAGLIQPDVSYPVTVTEYARGEPMAGPQEVDATSAALSTVVSDICVASGLTTAQIDVTQLTDEVLGYTRTNRMAARAAIDPLRAAYWFDPVESGDKIKFIKRGGAAVATIELDDLAGGMEEASEEPVETDRDQESELPNSIVVAYKAQSADYQTGTQQQRRSGGSSQQQQSLELAIVLTDQRAAEICDVLLYDAWISRNKRSAATSRKWAHIEPTDVITLDDGDFSYRVRVIDKNEDGGLITFKCADCDAAAYLPNSTAATTPGGGSTVRIDGPTRSELLDLPLLRDADDYPGLYVAASGYRDGWRGGKLYRSTDSGTSYAPYQDLTRTAVMGEAETALGDFTGGNIVDEINTLDVTINSGTLSSITHAQLLNNGNAAALGEHGRWEIIQFKRATLVSGRRWRLSGLLRGRLGTEAYMDEHEVGDRFVLLTADSLLRPESSLTYLAQTLYYKAVSVGEALSAVPAKTLANAQAGLKPLPPAHLSAVQNSDGGLSVKWVRRTRVGGAWTDSVEVPLGEASESYAVELIDTDDDVFYSTQVASTSTEIAALLPGASLSQPVTFLQDFNGQMIAANYPAPISLVRMSVDGDVLGVMSIVTISGRITAIDTNGDDVFVGMIDGSDPSYLYRVSKTSILPGVPLSAAATYSGTVPADVQGVAFDGTYVWVSESYTGRIRRLDAAALTVVNSYTLNAGIGYLIHDSTAASVFVADRTNNRVIQFSTSSNTVTQYLTGVFSPRYMVSTGTLLFAVGGSSLCIFDIATGVLLSEVSGITGLIADTGSSVVALDAASGELLLFSRTTGAVVGRGEASGANQIAGFADSAAFLTTLSDGAYSTSRLESPAIGSGWQVKVYQVSASVGRGFPASVTL